MIVKCIGFVFAIGGCFLVGYGLNGIYEPLMWLWTGVVAMKIGVVGLE